MSTLEEVTQLLKENGEDQLEIQLEIMSISQSMLDKLHQIAEASVASSNVSGVAEADISVFDMLTNQLVEGVVDRFYTSETEEFLEEANTIAREGNDIANESLFALRNLLTAIGMLNHSLDDINNSVIESSVVDGSEPEPVKVVEVEAKEDSVDSIEELQQAEERREEAPTERRRFGGLGLDSPLKGIKSMLKGITSFFKTISKIVGIALLGILAFGTDEQVEKMVDTLKNLFNTIADALEPVFLYLKEELLPKLVELIPVVLETIGLLFEKVISPLLTNVIMPLASMAMDGLVSFFEFVSDALKNPKEVAEEVLFDITDFFKDIGDFFGNAFDKLIVSLDGTINSVIDGLADMASNIPVVGESAAEKIRSMKSDFSSDARTRIEEREEESKARDRRAMELNAEKEVRRSGVTGDEAELVKLKSIQKQMIMSGVGVNDPELIEIERKIYRMERGLPPVQPTAPSLETTAPAISVPVRETPSVEVDTGPQRAITVGRERLPEFVTREGEAYRAYNPATKKFSYFTDIQSAKEFTTLSFEEAVKIAPMQPRVSQTNSMTQVMNENSQIQSEESMPSIVNAPSTSNVNNINSVSNNIMQEMPLARDFSDNYSGLVGIR